jgi:hypothetical protein
MSNPWDRPPHPSKGDPDQHITFNGVGRVLTMWETVEIELSHIYAICIGQYLQEEGYDRYYESARTTNNRIEAVQHEAERFAIRFPDQGRESAFLCFIRRVCGFADRRHEVAHGVVRPFHFYQPFDPAADPHSLKLEFCVAPPHFHRNWFDEKNMPRYIYTSVELKNLEAKLYRLFLEGTKIRKLFDDRSLAPLP